MRGLLALVASLALAWADAASALTPAQSLLLTGVGGYASITGQALAMRLTSAQFASTTDLTPVSQFVNGYTADVTLQGVTPAGSLSAYALGTATSPAVTITDQSPAYVTPGTPTTVTRTLYATAPLRETYPNLTVPTETSSGGNAVVTLVFNDFAYADDTFTGGATTAGWYNGGGVASSGVPITNASTRPYPRPVGAWMTEPGLRYTGAANAVVEFIAGHPYGQNGNPVDGVIFTMTDGTHSVSHTVTTQTQSTRIASWSCTATNGSATLTSCGDTSKAILGERFNVPNVPGQPILLSKTSTSLTFGSTMSGTPTAAGAITLAATGGDGQALADGAFLGSTIVNANLNGGTAVSPIAPTGSCTANCATQTLTLGAPAQGQWLAGEWVTGPNIPLNDYIQVSGTTGTGGAGVYKLAIAPTGTVSTVTGSYIAANPAGSSVTSVTISTTATSGTATATSTTINHVYQGVTGSVTATLGNPVPVYAATFTPTDFSTMSNGVIWFRAQVYPNIGDIVLDTQTGADGTGCDWWYVNATGTGGAGVCDSGNPAWFGSGNAAGAQFIGANLHNLWAYKDGGGTYALKYAWVSGTAGASPAVQTTSADPGSTAYYATPVAAATALKAAYGGTGTNGGVICLLAAGSPYAGFGGRIDNLDLANLPGTTITSVLSGSACPATGAAGSDTSVTIAYTATTANKQIGPWTHVNNLTISSTSTVLRGLDGQNVNTALVSTAVFEGDIFKSGGSSAALITNLGAWGVYNSLVDQALGDGNVLNPFLTSGAPFMIAGNTLICGTLTLQKANDNWMNFAGNDAWGCAPASNGSPATGSYGFLPLSTVDLSNKYMAMFNPAHFDGGVSQVFLTNDLFEMINNTSQPQLRLSGDNDNLPLNGLFRSYTGVVGARTNGPYLEGVPLGSNFSFTTTGGALPGPATYYLQATYALKTNPTVDSSTDGPTSGVVVATTTSTGSIGLTLPCDPNDNVSLFLGTSNPPTNYAIVNGADAKHIAMCQTVLMTAATGTAATPITLAATTAHNELKTAAFDRFNIDTQFNLKGDAYGGSGSLPSSGKVGNWEARWQVGRIGNVAVVGTAINSGYSATSGLGEIPCPLCTASPTNGAGSDLSWVKYQSDRSIGGGPPEYPALNLGEGDYCLNTSVTNPLGRVPSGFAAEPWDISGQPRLNDGTGAAGPYERGTCQ